jgi:hypothetical protein
MENALLYTFSTIAQALGGAFALLAAFALYRFQSLGPMMSLDSTQIRGELSRGGANFERYDTFLVQGKYAQLVNEIDAIRKLTQPKISASVEDFILRMKGNAHLQTVLAKAFRRAAYTTGAVMFYSVAAIPFAHIVACVDVLSWLLLIMGVGGFLACLHMFWAVIETAVYRQ